MCLSCYPYRTKPRKNCISSWEPDIWIADYSNKDVYINGTAKFVIWSFSALRAEALLSAIMYFWLSVKIADNINYLVDRRPLKSCDIILPNEVLLYFPIQSTQVWIGTYYSGIRRRSSFKFRQPLLILIIRLKNDVFRILLINPLIPMLPTG